MEYFMQQINQNTAELSTSYARLVRLDQEALYRIVLENQLLPIGKPVVYSVRMPIDFNKLLTLGQWLEKRKYGQEGSDLIPGLWQAFVNSKKFLTYKQDFIGLWIGIKVNQNGIDPESGNIVKFPVRIINGIITDSEIDWILNVCHPEQTKELLDNLLVTTAAYYPSCNQVDFKSQRGWKLKRNNWCIVPQDKVGDLILNSMPFSFTAIESSVCQFAEKMADNVIVQNNVNAHVRITEWYLQKGLNAVRHPVSSDLFFQPNKVRLPKDGNKIYPHEFMEYEQETEQKFIIAPLASLNAIDFQIVDNDIALFLHSAEKTIVYPREKGVEWLNTEIARHLQSLFNTKILQPPYDKTKFISDVDFM